MELLIKKEENFENSTISTFFNISTDLNSSLNEIVSNTTSGSLFYFYRIEQLTFLGILFFMIVIGNSAVLAALILTKTPRKSRMNFFIMHLALADLSVGLVNVLSDLLWKVTVSWYAGNVGCKIVKYFQTVVLYSSNYVLVALSIDRYDAITHPLKFSGSWRRARILVGSAWVLSLVFAIPAFLIFHLEILPHEDKLIPQCWGNLENNEWKIYLTVVFVILFAIPAVVIAACYTIMVSTIWSQSRILTPVSDKKTNGGIKKSFFRQKREILVSVEDDSRRASSRGLIPKAKIKSVKMTFVIVFVFILCSSPYFVFSLLQVYNFIPPTQSFVAISTFFQSLSPLNSAANPLIYCLFSTHIGRNLRKLRFINWLALKFCPKFGKLSPGANRKKFGPQYRHGDVSGKTRSDFTTSFTDSLLRSAKSGQSSRYASAPLKNKMDKNPSSIHLNNGKEVHFNTKILGTVAEGNSVDSTAS